MNNKSTQEQLLFNEERHEYSLLVNGEYQVIPGVTEILDHSGITDLSYVDNFVLERARKRGHEVHKITELHDRGEVSIPDDYDQHKYYPYLQAWCEFLEDFDPEIKEIEVKVCSRKHFYAGTIDRIVSLAIDNKPKQDYILDIKCGGEYASYGIQLAAYAYAYKEEMGQDAMFPRMCLHLTKEGGYYPHLYERPDDIDVFLSALTVVNWKDANNV